MHPIHRHTSHHSQVFPLRLIAFFLAVAAVVVVVLAQIAPANVAGLDVPAAAVSDEQFGAALAKAHNSLETSPAEAAAALQSVAGRFAVISPASEAGKAQWAAVTLNQRGKRVDAVRLRVPEGGRRDLVWAFAYPEKTLDRWYILPAKGPAGQGFKNFWKATPRQAFGSNEPKLKVIVQSHSGEYLEPGEEYVLWFRFTDDQPATLWIKAALLPQAAKAYDERSAMKALDLPQPPPAEMEPKEPAK
jgi:hypothetical protein